MACNKYRVLQLTNSAVGAVSVGSFLPLGVPTRRVSCNSATQGTFTTTSTGTNVVQINECGNYDVTYNGSLIAGAAGVLSVAIILNGVTVYSGSATATASGTVNITVPYQIRIFPNNQSLPNNVPAYLQLQLSGVAITGGTSNLKVERVY